MSDCGGGDQGKDTFLSASGSYYPYRDDNFKYVPTYDAMGNILGILGGPAAEDPYAGASSPGLVRFGHSASGTADAYDPEGRLEWIGFDKLDSLSFELGTTSQCLIDGSDVLKFGIPFQSAYPSATYTNNVRMDFNMDGYINGADVLKFGQVFLRSCPHFRYDFNGSLGRMYDGANGGVLIGDLYEKTYKNDVFKYYYAGELRIAMRKTNADSTQNLYYITQDNVGSTSLIMNHVGTELTRIRYTPFGEISFRVSRRLPIGYSQGGRG